MLACGIGEGGGVTCTANTAGRPATADAAIAPTAVLAAASGGPVAALASACVARVGVRVRRRGRCAGLLFCWWAGALLRSCAGVVVCCCDALLMC